MRERRVRAAIQNVETRYRFLIGSLGRYDHQEALGTALNKDTSITPWSLQHGRLDVHLSIATGSVISRKLLHEHKGSQRGFYTYVTIASVEKPQKAISGQRLKSAKSGDKRDVHFSHQGLGGTVAGDWPTGQSNPRQAALIIRAAAYISTAELAASGE
jgi:hypothetical protein